MKLSSISALVGTVAVGLSISVPAALSGSPASDAEAKYMPIQSISYEFGSKSVSGYFVQQATTCLVTLMIIERGDLEDPLPLSPTRVRLALYPGQIAGLDSEEGRSLNFTCGEDATALLVDVGDRERLVAVQSLALERSIAQRH